VIHRKKVRALIDQAEISGLELLDEALAQGKGVILTTYHGCWFETYFAWFSRGSRPASLIYQQQSNPLSDAFFVRLRKRYGCNLNHIHSLEKLSTYAKALEDNRILIISLDQNYTDNGTPVTFFKRQFTCARGTALLHLKTGAPVLTSVYYVRKDKLHIDFEKVDLPEYDEISAASIQEISNLSIKPYEKTITAYPDQWFSLYHRLWKKEGYPTKITRCIRQILS
jgi:KDO2-lipid IV(A) lauroyltransferase